jgi:hypothetical protein
VMRSIPGSGSDLSLRIPPPQLMRTRTHTGFGTFGLCPKGQKDSAWGFNPRNTSIRRPALTRRFVLVLVVVLVLESGLAERWSIGVWSIAPSPNCTRVAG